MLFVWRVPKSQRQSRIIYFFVMNQLSISQMSVVSGGREFQNWDGVCEGIKAGSIMYDLGVAFLGWTPVGWVCLGFAAAGLACMAAGY